MREWVIHTGTNGHLTGLWRRLEMRFLRSDPDPGVECWGDWMPSGTPSLGLRCTGVLFGVGDLLIFNCLWLTTKGGWRELRRESSSVSHDAYKADIWYNSQIKNTSRVGSGETGVTAPTFTNCHWQQREEMHWCTDAIVAPVLILIEQGRSENGEKWQEKSTQISSVFFCLLTLIGLCIFTKLKYHEGR